MSTVPPEFTPFIEHQVSTGRYQTPAEVIAAGFRLLQNREARLEVLRNELRPAIEELDQGGGIKLNEEQLEEYFTQLMAEVDAKLDAEVK